MQSSEALFAFRKIGLASALIFFQPVELICHQGFFQDIGLFFAAQVLPGLFRLLLQFQAALPHFRQQICQAGQVLSGIQQAPVHFFTLLPVFYYPRGFLQDKAALQGLCIQKLIQLTLTDDGIAFLAQTGAGKQIVHILHAHPGTIDGEFAFSRAKQLAGQVYFPVFQGQKAIAIVDQHLHRGHAVSPFAVGAAEDDIFPFVTAQVADVILAQYPADRIYHIAFAAAVRPHYNIDPGLELDCSVFRKRLKAFDVQTL